ncbi:MAG: Smr/MutS family protein, partial [Paludibacter sp.]|nr:Smr/MutS family protein [Paludibacter sp.]
AEKEKTKVVRSELQEFRERLQVMDDPQKSASKASGIKKPAVSKPVKAEPQSILQAGMKVRLKDQTATGTILEIQDKMATVAFGGLKSTVKLNRLEIISNNQLKKEKRQINAKSTVTEEVRSRKLNFSSEIDVRGMRADEALQAVTYFIDDAVMVGVASVRILHGTGTGALRQIIRQYLATVHGIRTYRDEHVQFGGAGITIVELEN